MPRFSHFSSPAWAFPTIYYTGDRSCVVALFHTRIYRLTIPTCGYHLSSLALGYALRCLHSCSAWLGLRIPVGCIDFSLSLCTYYIKGVKVCQPLFSNGSPSYEGVPLGPLEGLGGSHPELPTCQPIPSIKFSHNLTSLSSPSGWLFLNSDIIIAHSAGTCK